MAVTAQQAAEYAIRSFDWYAHGFDDSDRILCEPDDQWVPALAISVTRAILLKINYGSPFGVPTPDEQ